MNTGPGPSGDHPSDLGFLERDDRVSAMGDKEQEKAVGTLRAVSGSEGDDGVPEGDDSASGPRPDPLDRPWVHPSELRSFVANPLPPSQARPANG